MCVPFNDLWYQDLVIIAPSECFCWPSLPKVDGLDGECRGRVKTDFVYIAKKITQHLVLLVSSTLEGANGDYPHSGVLRDSALNIVKRKRALVSMGMEALSLAKTFL